MSLPEFFLDRIAADIQRQMDGMLALTDQLARHRLTPEAEACVAGVAESAEAVRRTLSAVLDLRSVDEDGLGLKPAPVRLQDLVDAIQDAWRQEAGGVTLLVSYDGDPEACVMGDGRRLLQIFNGFVGEAMAGARRGAVEVSLLATVCPEGLRLEGRVRGVRDANNHLKDIEARIRDLEARFGLDAALGLTLARQVLEQLGGVLHDEIHNGAAETVVFELTLPTAVEAAEDPYREPELSAHVLVVDDNATNRMVAQALCEMFDCSCESADDGAQALEAARTGRFDLILMDIKMPVMDGVAATRAIRALPGPAGKVPIIALTANADPEDAVGYVVAGMNGVVEKPMKAEHLLIALRQALEDSPNAEAAAA